MSMTGDRWPEVVSLYEAALERSVEEREAFLAEACADDVALREEVDSLLAQERAASPLDKPVWVADNLLVQPPALAIGASVGVYRVEGVLGAGGMGQVYRAKDTKLGRHVALKVLPDIFATDPERRARFQREAQVLAALNHPNIGAIHGFEDSGRVHALVLELVEGPTLADLLASGGGASGSPRAGDAGVPLADALPIARQIVDALEAAHDQGIIHRDLKPANIKVRHDGTVKVLDFGLARLVETEPNGTTDITNSPTLASPAQTTAGVILGTAAYMSPEQAKGRPADARSDVWAFGCVLYEMLTGTRPFAGEEVADTLAAVLRAEPDWSALPSATPLPVRRVLERCLQKDRKRRLAAIADVRFHFDDANAPEAVALDARPRSSRAAWLIAVAATLALIGVTATALRRPAVVATERETVRFTIPPPQDNAFGGPPGGGTGNGTHVAISPDGKRIAFVARKDGTYQIWVRSLGALSPTPVQGTEGGAFPFWSPDSRSIAFFIDDKLKKVEIDSGASVILCDAASGRGGSWSRDNVILFAPDVGNQGLRRVSAAGGTPTNASTVSRSSWINHRWPHFLPDGEHYLFTASTGACCPPSEPSLVQVASLDPQEPPVTLMREESSVIYSAGYLLFGRGETLMAQRFDAETRQLRGDAFPVAANLSRENGRYVSVSASTAGTLVFGQGGAPKAQALTWFERSGRVLGGLGDQITYETIAMSPDERQVAVGLRSGAPPTLDVWLFSLANGRRVQLTANHGASGSPVWSGDGARIVYESVLDNVSSLRQISSDGANDQVLAMGPGGFTPMSASRDGRFIAFGRAGASGSQDIWALPLTGNRVPIAVVQTPGRDGSAAISPNGRWLAYSSDESGRSTVFVQPFPGPGLRRVVSTDGGGGYPVWRGDGRELFYIATGGSRDGMLMAVQVDETGEFQGTEPQPLFRPNAPRFNAGHIFVATKDGRRFLFNARQEEPNSTPITVILNWAATLPSPSRPTL
jgi:eukaryotic-like serine/threonine-protein kinase